MPSLIRYHAELRWGARALGLLSLALYAPMAARERFDTYAMTEGVIWLGLLALAAVAYFAAWRYEAGGGTALALIGIMLGGWAFAFAREGAFLASLTAGLPWFLTGILFILSSETDWTTRRS